MAPPPQHIGGVSCVSKTWRMAAGDNLVEFWNGRSWKAPPAHYGFFRNSVTCLSMTFCASLGVVAIRWTGKDWIYFGAMARPDFYGEAVWCGGPANCMASGSAIPILPSGMAGNGTATSRERTTRSGSVRVSWPCGKPLDCAGRRRY